MSLDLSSFLSCAAAKFNGKDVLLDTRLKSGVFF